MMTIIETLLPVAIKILGLYFERKEGQKEARLAFLNFVEKMQAQADGSAKIRSSYQAQIERLKKKGTP